MILLTGAAGKTGRAVLQALLSAGAEVRVLAHSEGQVEKLTGLGAKEAFWGDIRDASLIKKAVTGVKKVYHICPNVSPDEFLIGKTIIQAAREAGISRFVYHSVLHPQAEAMPHHWQKMRVEEYLFTAGMNFTVLQPCAYMQNIVAGWKTILATGVYSTPYSIKSRFNLVDLEDVGIAAAKVLLTKEYENAILECSGPESLSQEDIAGIISVVSGKQIYAERQDPEEWASYARQGGMDAYQIATLQKMFEYYDHYGLVGNSTVLKTILGKPPRSLEQFLAWYNQNSTRL